MIIMKSFKKPDRTWKNSDGTEFLGYDGDDGKTTWYDKNGNLDAISDTPSDFEQERNDEGY